MTGLREKVDYSHEVKVIGSRPLRIFLLGLAYVSLFLGILGIFLPLLPTTPFILIAAACYARCSPKLYNWLMNHQRLGPALRRWKETGSITRRTKFVAISMLAVTMIPTIIFVVPVMAVKVLLALIGISVTVYMLRLPTA